MSLPQIRDEFRVPARYGARVQAAPGYQGTITGSTGDYLTVQFDGDDGPITIHPTELTYPTTKEN